MSHFCLLADPANYSVSDFDLLKDEKQRAYWLDHFESHLANVLEAAKVSYGRTSGKQAQTAREQFAQTLQTLRANPTACGPRLGVMELCRLREKALRDNRLNDPYRHVKIRENRAALEMYDTVLDYVYSLEPDQRWEHLFRGVFGGNIFDLGSVATMNYAHQEVDFEAVVEQVKPRPWVIDDFDALKPILPIAGSVPTPWAKVIVFVDNAGADFVLGVMPLVRELAAAGTHVVLAANELPSLNDITADEMIELVENLAATDEELGSYVAGGFFEVVSTGNDLPLIDLSNVSDELNEAAKDAELVILEGMGRSVESNFNTKFNVDSIQLCLLKDPIVAAKVGGATFDCVCKYTKKPE
jgi:type II pantothenate kinase